MATRRRRREKEGSPVTIAIASLVILLCFTAFGYGGWAYWQASQKGQLDADLCPSAGPTAATVFLFDFTDPVSSITQSDLRNEFQKVVGETKPGNLIEAFILTGEEGTLKRTFHGCNPGDGADVSVWTGNPEMLKKRWRESFEKPLKEAMDEIEQNGAADRSPIMAGIQRIVIDSLSKPGMNVPKKIVVASDMIEHTDAFSNYRDGVDYEVFAKTIAHEKFRTNLEGITVKILAFERQKAKFDSGELGEFWADWIEANHGEFDKFVRLSGAN